MVLFTTIEHNLLMLYHLYNQALQTETGFILQEYQDWQASFNNAAPTRFYHILLLTTGNGKITYSFNEYSFEAPCIIFSAAYQPFTFSSTASLNGVVLQFATDFFCIDHNHSEVGCQGLLFNNVYDSPYVALTPTILSELSGLIGNIKTEFETQEKPDPELVSTYLKLMLKIAVREKKKQLNIEELNNIRADKPLLTELKLAIEQHYKSEKSPSYYADKLNISSKALGKLVKEQFGRTLTDMIQERVVYEAKHQLFTTKKPVKEIADLLGYDDPYYFSRLFKNVTTISPEKYRQTIHY